ncbi:uncharacterized protein LOC143247099 isoform X2 [Tachypleus tridentatus]|uniref:uncharacterized protein LOC143247099 isoform X2 n=1 Tax=Tachypleus tridentatus TaxID=6853 RepID=UPI003FD108DA
MKKTYHVLSVAITIPLATVISGTVSVSSLILHLLFCFLVIKRRRRGLGKCVYPESFASVSCRVDTQSSASCL